jgi:regulator of RNase E activity RraA
MLNMPISCGGVVVNPGDVVIADDSGVLILPPEEAEQVADDALARQEKGLANQERVAAGEKLGELSGASLKVVEAANG